MEIVVFFFVFSQILLVRVFIFSNCINAEKIGSISGIFISSSAATIAQTNGSCTNCICMMLTARNILSVSCTPNQTCLLFYNYSVPYTINNSTNSSFHFLVLPPEPTYSTAKSTASTQTTMITTPPNTSTSRICVNMTILINYDMPGGDLASYVPKTITECCALCLTTVGCLGFVWGWPNNTNPYQVSRCWIKGTLATPTIVAQFTSAHF